MYNFGIECMSECTGGEMADTLALGASAVRHGGSSPLPCTRSNLFGIKNMERFCGSQNRALIFAKTLSAYGGSREIP